MTLKVGDTIYHAGVYPVTIIGVIPPHPGRHIQGAKYLIKDGNKKAEWQSAYLINPSHGWDD